MDVSAVAPPVAIKAPEVPPPNVAERKPDVQNGAPADGTRTAQPTVLAALPPGQGTRVDRLA